MKKTIQLLSVFAISVALAASAFAQGAVEFKQLRGSKMVQSTPDSVLGFDHNQVVTSKPAGFGYYVKLAADVPTASSATNLTTFAFTVPAGKTAKVELVMVGAQAATAYGAIINTATTTGVTGTGGAIATMIDTAGAVTRGQFSGTVYFENTTGSAVTITPRVVRGAGSTAESTVKAGSWINVVISP
jgi:hypothetical protein